MRWQATPLSALEGGGSSQQSDPGDRRNLRIELTRDGKAQLAHDPVTELLAALDRLPVADRRALSDGLDKLLRETLRRRGGRPFGSCKSCRFFQKQAKDGAPHRCGLLEVPLSAEDGEKICIEQETAA